MARRTNQRTNQLNRALIIGISNYDGKAPNLDSPEREIEEWRDLLVDAYEFDNDEIRLLATPRARRDEILRRINWLFSDVNPGDQRVLYYAGHGVRMRRRDFERNDELLDGMDEAILAYPSASTDDVETMAIFDNEVFDIYANSDAPKANVTFILDCCHGGGFNSEDMPRQPRIMSVTPPVDLRHRSINNQSAQRNDWSGSRVQMPVVVNAAGELNRSIELVLDGERRSLFSYYALQFLRQDPRITYEALAAELRKKIDPVYPQHCNLRGNRRRMGEPFLH